jgi:hypothetical protein
VARVEPSDISGDISTCYGHWAIAQENSSFFFYRLYHAAGGRKSGKQFHPTITGGELNKATEISWNEESDATCSIGQSASTVISQTGIKGTLW